MKTHQLAVAALLLGLAACGGQNDGAAKGQGAAANSQAASAAASLPARIDNMVVKSPFMDFQVNANRALIIKDIKSQFQLTPEQNACLHSLEGNATYLEVLQPYFQGILSADEIKEADAFFATDAGGKFADMMLRQMGAENLPPAVEPTAAEKAEIAQALVKPFFAKVKAKTDAMNEKEALDFAVPMVKKELARCKIGA